MKKNNVRNPVASLGRVSQEALQASRRKVLLDRALTSMIDAVPDYVLVLNEQRQILAANRRVEETFHRSQIDTMLGLRSGEALGCVFADEGGDGCGSGRHCTFCGAAASIRESQQFNRQTVHECRLSIRSEKEGHLDLLVVSTPAVIEDMRLTICIMKDISAEKWREIMVRVFFHDVLNTAGGIHGIASLLQQGNLEEDPKYKKWLLTLSERLIDEITHQQKLLSAENGDLIPSLSLIEVPLLLSEVCSLYENHDVSSGVSLMLGAVPACTVFSDQSILRRILGNLVKNAIEATSPSGTVTISCRETATDVAFQIHNAGTIPPEVQLQIFQRSFTTKGNPGRGVGTYSARLFAERYLRGTVSFTSDEAGGTTFTLTIPNATAGIEGFFQGTNRFKDVTGPLRSGPC